MEKCKYINQGDSDIHKCQSNVKYGGYCCKHKREYLVDSNDLIIRDRFTNKMSDYLVKDLSRYYYLNIDPSKKKSKMYKKDYFLEIQKYIHSLQRYTNIDSIIRIQRMIRKYLKNDTRCKCNNNEDFYTFIPLSDIESKYFFSYKDSQNIWWGFDIRSLIKLIDMGFTNPYTTEKLPENIIQEVKNKINILENNDNYENIQEIIQRDRKSSIKQRIVDLFSDIELSNFSCQINWFFDLRGRQLKELYRQLEDIWNYRAQLSNEMKCLISPPDGKIFTTPVSEVDTYNSKEDIQELIIHDISSFKNAINPSDKKLGYMYFIIGLSIVSRDCLTIHHNWVAAAL